MSKKHIYYKTFFQKGIKEIYDPSGVYLVSGFQGSGKNYFTTFILNENYDDLSKFKIRTNVSSLKIPKYEIEYFKNLNDILQETENFVIYVIDEISKKYTKNSPPDKQFYSWLQQSRKRKRIVFLITQEFKEIPMWLRRPCRFVYTTHKIPFFPIFKTTKGDCMNMTLNNETMEWECPILETYYYKRTKYISNLYDTYEPISQL